MFEKVVRAALAVKVTQAELERICELQRARFGINRELRELEHEARDLLLAGAEVEKGCYEVRLCDAPPGVKPKLAVIEHPPSPTES